VVDRWALGEEVVECGFIMRVELARLQPSQVLGGQGQPLRIATP
jgi:hypothetical protein